MALHRVVMILLAFTIGPMILFSSCAPQKPQTYTNPIGEGNKMGDPFVIKYENTYYLTGTTNSNDGFRIWSSSNLVNWEPHEYAYQAATDAWGKNSFWAPELFRKDDKYYLAYSVNKPKGNSKDANFRLCLAVSDKPEGPYKDIYTPWCDFGDSVIDAHVFIDDDGKVYLYYAKVGVIFQPKFKLTGEIYGVQLKPDLSGALTDPVLVSKPEQKWERPEEGRALCNEGAFVFREGNTYYLTYSANSYDEPFYAIGYSTASSPLGPWTKAKENPLMKLDKKIGVSGPGHSCMTTSPDGKERFIIYHAHANPNKPSGERTVNMDRVTIENGKLKVIGPTRSTQPVPSGATIK